MFKVRQAVVLVAVVFAVSAVAVPAALAAHTAHFSGVVLKVSMASHSFTLKRSGGPTVVLHTTHMTHYKGLMGFSSLKKGQHLAVLATRQPSGSWRATSITKM